MPRVWDEFKVDDNTLTRGKYNYYSGWQYVLDHLRTQNCLTRIGPLIRGLDFRPKHSFNNLFQFMTLIAWCMEQVRSILILHYFNYNNYIDFCKCQFQLQAQRENCTQDVKNVGVKIRKLTYVFPCNMAAANDPEGVKLFGTGGF